MSYVEEIDQQIDKLRTELIKLEHAREVMAKLEKRGPKLINLAADPPAAKKSAPITIAKIKPARAPLGPPLEETPAETRERILKVLEAGAMKSGEIVTAFGDIDSRHKQRVWALLTKMKEADLIRYEDGKYSLSEKESGHGDGSH